MGMITRLKNLFIKISTSFGNIALFAMMLMIVTEVILRTFFHTSTMISEEYAGYFMGIVVFWGAAQALNDGSFVRIQIAYDRYKGRAKKIFDLACDTIVLVFNSYLVYFFYGLVQQAIKYGAVSFGVSRTPLWIPRGILLVGMVIFEITLILRLIEDISKPLEQKSAFEMAKEGGHR